MILEALLGYCVDSDTLNNPKLCTRSKAMGDFRAVIQELGWLHRSRDAANRLGGYRLVLFKEDCGSYPSTNGKRINECAKASIRLFVGYSWTAIPLFLNRFVE